MANFGGKPSISPKNWPLRFIIFTCFLSGSIVWIHYRASMTSELAARKTSMPFDSLETLLTSSYELIVKKGGNSESTFRSSPKNSDLYKLNEQKVSEFLPTDEALRKINGTDRPLAFYYALETILDFKEYKCKVRSKHRWYYCG